MHDIFEGIARYTIEGVLTHLILTFQKITLQTENESIAHFIYGPLESKNIPQPLEIETCSEEIPGLGKKVIKCRQSAAEISCLSRHLSLMIRDKYDPNDEYWNLYLKLSRLIGIVTAPIFVLADMHDLKETSENFSHNSFDYSARFPLKVTM